MLAEEKISLNIKTLTWWCKYRLTANTFEGRPVGYEMNVSVYDVMPNLRQHSHPTGCEFEVKTGNYSQSNDKPIEVFLDSSTDKIVIYDGHHRFNEAILEGKKRIDVKIVRIESDKDRWVFNALSDEQYEKLKNA